MAEFETPIFLKNHSPEEVHEVMKRILPADIDVSQGGHAYNFTMPTALIAAEMCEFVLPEVIKLIFPQWSYGEFLDYHAKDRRIYRKAANAAAGKITITATVGTVIPAGSIFSTASVNGEPSVDYETLEEVKVPDSGTVTVAVQCVQAGVIGNTQANTIVMVANSLSGITAVTNEEALTGITAVTNEEAMTGGTEEEDDESLIQRIDAYDRSLGDSFVGSAADYKRWALEVSGVGDATVIPAQDTSGMVTIVLTDANGKPATEQLCTAVYNHIMRPDNPNERLANVNALLQVLPPDTTEIGITATVELSDNATLESVKAAYMAQLALYLPEALDAGEVKYSRVWALLSATEGVNDFTSLQIGPKIDGAVTYGTSNIAITTSQLPTISADDLILTAGTV